MSDFLSFIRIPDHSQKSSTTCRRRVIPSGDSQTNLDPPGASEHYSH
jgi:hypothetical protein